MLISASLATFFLLTSSIAPSSALRHGDETSQVRTVRSNAGGYKFRLAPRSSTFVNGGMFNKEAFEKESTRLSQKYTKMAQNYLINRSDQTKVAQVRRREAAMFEAAQKIEKQALEAELKLSITRRDGQKGRGHVPLTDVSFTHGYDCGYAGPVSFGTPAQELMVDFDTGSGDTWILGSHALTKHPHNKFDTQRSSTFTAGAHVIKWNEIYGSGSLGGVLVQDRVAVGGYVVTNQRFGVTSKTLPVLDGLKIDGVMGLAFPASSMMNVTSFMENLLQGKGNHPLPLPVASFHLQRGRKTGGELYLGAIDTTMFKGHLNYLPVTQGALWQVHSDGVVVNNNLIKGTKMLVALDTGSALIKVPSSVANKLFAHLHGGKLQPDGTYTLPCQYSSLKSFAFSIGGETYHIPSSDLIMGIYDENDPTQCVFGIFADDRFQDTTGKPMAVLGDLFLKTVYSVFNYSRGGQASIGLAPLREHQE